MPASAAPPATRPATAARSVCSSRKGPIRRSPVVALDTRDTSFAGAHSGTATVALVSNGSGTSGLGTTNRPSQTITVAGNVYRYAAAGSHTPEPVDLSIVHVNESFG